MPTVADCLRQHGETFLQQYSDKISLQQRKVLNAIQRCRTGELGSVRRSPSSQFSVFSFQKLQQRKTPANNVSGLRQPSGSSNRVKGVALVGRMIVWQSPLSVVSA